MDENLSAVNFDGEKSEVSIVKWKVKPGSKISQGTVLMLYKTKDDKVDGILKKWKAVGVGTVIHLLKQEGDLIKNGCPIMNIKGCSHPVVMKDMCAECGEDLRYNEKIVDNKSKASVAMVHCIPELRVSEEQAQILGKADEARLFENRKLVLLVDLDQTLIHTTNDDVDPNMKDVYHFQLYGGNSPWMHTKIRPGTSKFLENISKLYELHICTFGSRLYAHTVVQFLDKDGKYFSYRILSRDECFSANSKTANLSALFPCGDNLVCIIDDREDVWNFAPNLVHVKPYHFFQHTGDINAPPGLTKVDLDETDCKVNVGNYKRLKSSAKFSKRLKTENQENTKCKAEKKSCNNPAEQSVPASENEEQKSNGLESMSRDNNDPESDENAPVEVENPETPDTIDDNDNDNDDYLLYLTDILSNIHQDFYGRIDKIKSEGSDEKPDLKSIVPYTRRKVLKDCNIVFSGVVPINMPIEKSKAYFVAKSLGAEIQKNLVSNGSKSTTHVVAARLGTVKVNEAKKIKGVHVISPDWLWCCSERWERVDEKLFPLTKDMPQWHYLQKDSPHYSTSNSSVCSDFKDNQSQNSNVSINAFPTYDPVTGKRINKSGPSAVPGTSANSSSQISVPGTSGSTNLKPNFATTINPLLAFCSEDIAKMDQEVDDEMDSSDSDDDDKDEQKDKENQGEEMESSSSSGESLSADYPRKWTNKQNERKNSQQHSNDVDDTPKYPRGELPHDSDRSESNKSCDSEDDFDNSIGSVDDEMVAAVEREFLGS